MQGADLFICVYAPTNSDIEISAVEELDLTQGNVSIAAVDNSTSDALTAVFLFGKIAVIRSQLPSNLFDATNPANLTAAGQISVRFGSGARRNLRFGVGNNVHHDKHVGTRMMQAQAQAQAQKEDKQAGFLVTMALAPLKESEKPSAGAGTNTGAIVGGIVGGIAGVAIIVALLLAGRRRKQTTRMRLRVHSAYEHCQ